MQKLNQESTMIRRLSSVMLSNLYTMEVASQADPRQNVPDTPGIPPEDVRLCRARLILEEAIETINALGFTLCAEGDFQDPCFDDVDDFDFKPDRIPSLEDIIDGCCDSIYVCTGTLASCGVPDMPHLEEVCRANNAKFPGGKVIVNNDGKFLKPVGWTPPDHQTVLKKYDVFSLKAFAQYYVTLVPLQEMLEQP